MVFPLAPITDESDETAHLLTEEPKVIQYSHTTKDHSFMIDRVLGPDQGITHDVFKEPSAAEEEPAADEEGEEGAPKAQPDILTEFKHVFVEEVVREPRMDYQKVPRLGSFMAVPLVYESCLSDEALDAYVQNTRDVEALKEEQRLRKEEYDNEQAAAKEAAEQNGETYEDPEKAWTEISIDKPITSQVKYVVCLDTMGQDRQFTDEQRRFVLSTVRRYQLAWEKAEETALTNDRDVKLKQTASSEEPGEAGEEVTALAEEVERIVEEYATANQEELPEDQIAKDLILQKVRLQTQAR